MLHLAVFHISSQVHFICYSKKFEDTWPGNINNDKDPTIIGMRNFCCSKTVDIGTDNIVEFSKNGVLLCFTSIFSDLVPLLNGLTRIYCLADCFSILFYGSIMHCYEQVYTDMAVLYSNGRVSDMEVFVNTNRERFEGVSNNTCYYFEFTAFSMSTSNHEHRNVLNIIVG